MVRIYGHPFASFYWKALIALYEREVPFEFLMVDPDHPENLEAIGRLAPTGQFPVLVDGDRTVIESAAIIEYLDLHHGDAPPMVPADPRAAIEARQMDSVFDDYVMAPLTGWFSTPSAMRTNAIRMSVIEAKATLDKSYAWLNRWMTGREWAANDVFGIADCAAAPALFYAHWGYRSRSRTRRCGTIARVCSLARRSRASSTRQGRGAPNFPAQGAHSGLTAKTRASVSPWQSPQTTNHGTCPHLELFPFIRIKACLTLPLVGRG